MCAYVCAYMYVGTIVGSSCIEQSSILYIFVGRTLKEKILVPSQKKVCQSFLDILMDVNELYFHLTSDLLHNGG